MLLVVAAKFASPKNDTVLPDKQVRGSGFSFSPVSAADVIKAIHDLPADKAAGIDCISAIMIKKSAAVIALILAELCNRSLSKGVFPECWKTALIIPVHKKGDPFDIANYRPISLLPLFSKILEKLALSQLSCYLSDGNLLSNKQHGFRCRRSTETALGHLSGLISEAKKKKLHTILVTIDFSKAFDVLDVNVLLRSLASIDNMHVPG